MMNSSLKARFGALAGLGLALGLAVGSAPAQAASDHGAEIPVQRWSFAGVRGQFDRAQLQRGFQVYKEVCSTCHGVRQLSFRNLVEKGGPEFPEEGVKNLAATYKINDVPNDQGKVLKRAGRLSDRIPTPFDNEQQARSANNNALPPDLSLIARARGVEAEKPFYMVPWHMLKDVFISGGYQEAGADYLYALLTGYKDMPKDMKNPDGTDMKMSDGMYFNAVYPGHQIGMPSPLTNGVVKYSDGTPATVENYARDFTAFSAWAADPKLEERKRMGLMVMLYLLITSLLLYLAKRYVWADVPH
jgi:ubiquinol-cytochrome c reductase cytochrome c1 subunit